MKKYLMTGIAALALGAGFTSCSHDIEPMTQEEINQIEAQKIVQTYEQAFIKTFGQPAANQNWGFGAANLRTRDANTEHNQWAAVDNIYKLLVPPALTSGQIQRVKIYFQYNRYLTYEDPKLTDFFVQQVYEGSTSPGTLSAEVYTSGNGARVKAGDHMNQLTVGTNSHHVNDFNKANCGESDVLNNGTEQNNYVPNGTTHKDKITLMLGESTECVGFHVTEGNVQHNDCCALAGAQTIDDWANSDEVKAWAQENNIDLGSTVVDGWNRSFVGLDYEQKSPDQCFTTKNNSEYVYRKDFMSKSMNWILYQGQMVAASTLSNDQLFFPNGEPVRWVIDNTNEFLGENLGTTQNTFNKQGTKEWFKNTYNVDITNGSEDYYDLDAVLACVNQGAYPKMNNMEFIKGLGGRDYIFSDWIVTLTPATHFTQKEIVTPPTPSNANLRIIAEDLSVGDGDEDFDFNDVVFDVYYGAANEAKAVILAAGGTLDLKVDGREVHALFGSQYAGKMINTNGTKNSDANVRAKSVDDLAPVEITLTKEVRTPAQARDNIKVEVYKNGQWVELTAIQGKVASKVRVGTDYTWSDEREFVGNGFKAYVAGQANYNDWYVNE